MVYVWALIAAICIVSIEIAYVNSAKWLDYWYIIFPSMVIGNFCIYTVIKGTTSILSAFILYSAITLVGRTVYAVASNQPVNMWIWSATFVMVIAMALRFVGAK